MRGEPTPAVARTNVLPKDGILRFDATSVFLGFATAARCIPALVARSCIGRAMIRFRGIVFVVAVKAKVSGVDDDGSYYDRE
jgi:hypothetical protein